MKRFIGMARLRLVPALIVARGSACRRGRGLGRITRPAQFGNRAAFAARLKKDNEAKVATLKRLKLTAE